VVEFLGEVLHVEVITGFDQLHSRLDEAQQAAAISDDAFRKSLSSWYLSPAMIGEVPKDPFSHEYKTVQIEFYKRLANEDYDVAHELTDFDFDHNFRWPYPYGTKSAQTVGIHLIGYGWLIRKMNLPPESRILEIGSGFGPLTVHLASMGYRVTCLDISASLLDFVKARTAHLPQQVETICGDMATVELGGPYDAVIFNASLHHSFEHRVVVHRLVSILDPDGIVAFTAEPVVPDNSSLVPYPWGIRLDGLGIWAICKEGWLELGFQESYFVQVLKDAGWELKRAALGITGQTDVWIGSRAGPSDSVFVEDSASRTYAVDLETEVIRLNRLVEGYERGRFIRLMKWLKSSIRREAAK
jgi:2-polyprenyl-3-methyl-5-hydroxy-6-metoxy-1,4-benzoquinol methylase